MVINSNTATTEANLNNEKSIVNASKLVLNSLKNKDYKTLANMTSSQGLTVSLSPYKIFDQEVAWINGNEDSFNATSTAKKNFSREEVSRIGIDNKEYIFGNTDGKGDPIKGNTQYYFDRWVYNYDYINAPEVYLNKVQDTGNTINTINEDVGSRDFILYHFPGFREEVKGFDWTSMYLIFEKENGEYKLRAIAKDNWTI